MPIIGLGLTSRSEEMSIDIEKRVLFDEVSVPQHPLSNMPGLQAVEVAHLGGSHAESNVTVLNDVLNRCSNLSTAQLLSITMPKDITDAHGVIW